MSDDCLDEQVFYDIIDSRQLDSRVGIKTKEAMKTEGEADVYCGSCVSVPCCCDEVISVKNNREGRKNKH